MRLLLQNDALTTEANYLAIRDWRNEQRDILRTQEYLSVDKQREYAKRRLSQDAKRFSNKEHMWGIVTWEEEYNDREFIGYCGLTNIEWGAGFVIKSETSFIVDPAYTKDPVAYENIFTFFLTEVKRLFFFSYYWNGHRLYSESYDLPHRQHHISILEKNGFKREGVLKEHVMRDGAYYDSIFHGLNRGDL